MAEPRSTMIDPPIEELLDKVDSKFTLVTLSAKRARQINAYFNQLGEGLGAVVPPQVTSLARKPLSIAMEEIAASKVQAGAPEVEEAIDLDSDAAAELAMLAALADEVEDVAEAIVELETADEPTTSGDLAQAEDVGSGASEAPEIETPATKSADSETQGTDNASA
jgi:DNA-directed RNA polymerase subunit omega